jgi:hypothetical protein
MVKGRSPRCAIQALETDRAGRRSVDTDCQPPNGTARGRREAQILEHFDGADMHASREQGRGRLVLGSANRYRFEITTEFVAEFDQVF